MSYQRRVTALPPRPFTGMLNTIDYHAVRHEGSIKAYAKEGLPPPEDHMHQARALRAIERLLVGTERFWSEAPPAAMSLKEMMARHEATEARTRDPAPVAPAASSKVAPPPQPAPVRAADDLGG